MTTNFFTDLSPDKLFAELEPKGIVLVAVSGGGDSVGLLLLANAWANRHNIALHAVTVDHGLRPEAAAEAAYVASLCDGMGIDHTTLGWEGIKPHSGIADAARRARYTLMEEFALEIGADLILTGHTADDQAETVYMRLMREREIPDMPEPGPHNKSGGAHSHTGNVPTSGRGLAGMARRSLLPGGCELARPLLGISRARLRSYLGSFPQNWIEDPTNWDVSYERVRIRNRLQGDSLLSHRLGAFAKVMGGFRHVLSRDTAQLLMATVNVNPGPVFLFDHAIAAAAPVPVLIHAFQMLIAVAGGGEYLVSPSKIQNLQERLALPEFGRTNLGGAIIERSGTNLRFYREMRGIGSITVEPGERLVWDGRMEIFNAGHEQVSVGPLTRQGLDEVEQRRERQLPARPRAALLSAAIVRAGNRKPWLPMVERGAGTGEVLTRLTARAVEQFCPESDFAMLEWLQGLDSARNDILQWKT